MNQPQIVNNLKDLNKSFVLIKKYNTKTLFYSGRGTHSYDAANAMLFYTQIEAETKCLELNQTRKKLKYRLENAGKYFINNVQVNFTSTYNLPVNIELINKVLPIERIISNKLKVSTSDKIKQEITSRIKSHIEGEQTNLNNSNRHYNEKIDNLERQIAEHKKQQTDNQTRVETAIANFQALDAEEIKLKVAELIKGSATPALKMYQLLYETKARDEIKPT